MSYSTSFPHAILAMLYITDTIQLGKFDFVPIQHLSAELNIPPSTMGVIIRHLNRAGLVETREGAKGGIRHARPPAMITIYDVFKAIEQERPLFQTLLNPRVTGAKPTKAQEAIVAVLQSAETAMIQRLRQTTLADLLHELSV
jgi:Rrf2 family protein